MVAYFEANKAKLKIRRSVLLHADITNPGNILVKNGAVSGFIDWEWVMAGDPAWEFAFENRYSLDTYFRLRHFSEREKKDFRERVTFLRPILLTWYLSFHARGDRNMYRAIRNHLTRIGF